MEKTPENKNENQEDGLNRIKEIDEIFRRYEFTTVEGENGEDMAWSESRDADALKKERSEILLKYKGTPDFDLAFAAYEAPREGKETKDKEQMKEIIRARIAQLKKFLKTEEEYLRKLENEK